MTSSSCGRGTAGRWAKLAILLIVFTSVLPLFAGVTVESISSAATAGNRNTLSFSHTIVGNYRYLVVEVTLNTSNSGGTTVTGVTYNGNALARITPNNPATNNNRRVEFWGINNPNAGPATIVVNTSGSVGFAAAAITLNGINPTTPTPATGAVLYANSGGFGSTNATAPAIASANSGLVLDALAALHTVTATPGAGQTQLWSKISGGNTTDVYGAGSYELGTGANITMSEALSANSTWKIGAATFNPYATVADLSIVGAFSPDPVAVNSNTTLTFTITNNGPSSATGATFSTTGLPTNLTGVSAYSSVGTCTVAANISCSLGTMANGAIVSVTILGTASAAGAISSTGSVTINEYDPYANSTYTATAVAQNPVCVNPGKDGVGNVTGTVNTYFAPSAAVVLSPGATSTSVTLSAGVGASNGIAVGDLLIIMQMQDADIDSDNDQRYGDGIGTPGNVGTGAAPAGPGAGYTNLNSSGRFEYIVATSAVPNGGGAVLSFTGAGAGGGLLYTYTEAAATTSKGVSTFQIVRVPQYSAATLGNGGNVAVAPAWDGAVGGVFAMDVAGTLTLNGTVNVDALGFRGAGGLILGGTGTGVNTDYVTLSTNPANGGKGEGIAGTPRFVLSSTGTLVDNGAANEGLPNGSYGRGAPATAGGGGTDADAAGNTQNDGGGGGGNGGAGGMGGESWNTHYALGGYGGVAFPATLSRITMGGGGGEGTTNNGTQNGTTDTSGIASSGGPGGGIVIIRADQVTGTGTISADGGPVNPATYSTQNDSTGGGGAGGTIIVVTKSSLSGLTVSASGGTAGTAWSTQASSGGVNNHGPGGGGGGGVVFLSSAAASVNVSGGQNGTTTTSALAFGAYPGSAGIYSSSASLTSLPGAGCNTNCADLALVSVPSATLVATGNVLTYTQTVTNNGLSDATNLFFTTTVPTGTTYQSITIPTGWSCTTPAVGSTGTISCVATSLTAGSSSQFIIATSVTAGAGTVLTNDASVYAETNDPNLYNNSTQTVVTVGTAADLAVTDSANPKAVASGSTATLTHVVTFAGGGTTSASFKETFPSANATIVTLPSAAGWNACTSATAGGTTTITCTTATNISNGSTTFTTVLNITGTNGTVVTDSANITGSSDAYPGNDNASATVTIGTTGTDLALTDQASPLTIYAGNYVTYSHTIVNNGPNTSGTVTFTDTLPAGVTFQSVTAPPGWNCSGTGPVTCTTTGFGAGSAAAIQVTDFVPATTASGTVLTDSATVANSTGDPVSSNNTATATSTVATGTDLAVSVTSSTLNPVPTGGGTETVVFNMVNNGPSGAGASQFAVSYPTTINGTAITPALTPPVTAMGVTWSCNPPSGGTIFCSTSNNVPTGYSGNFSLMYAVPAAPSNTAISDTASVNSTVSDKILANNSATFSTVVAGAGDAYLTITQTMAPSAVPVTAGQTETVYWTVANNGPAAANNPVLKFMVPTGTTLQSYSVYSMLAATCTLSGSTLTCKPTAGPTTTFPSGFSQSVSFTLLVNSSTTSSFMPSVSVTSTTNATPPPVVMATPGPDGNPATASANVTIPVITSADLSVTDVCTPVDVQVGGMITCTQTITNNGPSDAMGVKLTDPPPVNTSGGSATITSGGGGGVCGGLLGNQICSGMTIGAGAQAVITYTATVTGGSSITDTTSVTATTSDPNSANNSASSTVTVATATQSDIAVAFTTVPTSATAGSNITYVQTLTNYGPAAWPAAATMPPATPVLTIVESTPPNTTFVSFAQTGGSGTWTCPASGSFPAVGSAGSFTCTLNAGLGAPVGGTPLSSSFTFVVQANSGLADGTVITDTVSSPASTVTPVDPNPVNNSASGNTTIADANVADVAVTISASNTSPRMAMPDTLTITATNNGPSTATNTTVTIPLPSQEQYVSVSSTQGNCTLSGSTVTCMLGSMANAATATITLVVNTINYGLTTNTATISADQTDNVPSNNTASTGLTILAQTDIKLVSFAAAWNGSEVELHWRTGEEVRNLGFNIYREVNGQRVQVNPSLIAGSAVRMRAYLPQHTASAYNWIDAAPVSGAQYWLEDVSLSGVRTLHGPVQATGAASARVGARVQRSTLLSRLNAAATPSAPAPVTTIVPVAPDISIQPQPLFIGGRPTRGGRAADVITSATLAGEPAIKIGVNQEGWYRITQAQLAAAGIDLHADPKSYRLIDEGAEVPISVSDAGDIEFYGIGIDTPYSDRHVYWLIWGSVPGMRLQQVDGTDTNLPSELGYGAEAVREDHTFYFAALTTNGEEDNFFGDIVSGTPVDEHLEISGIDQTSPTAQLDVRLQGITDPADHDVSVSLNGTALGEIKFSGMDQQSLVANVPTSLLKEGDNVISLTPLGGSGDVTTVAHVIVLYQRTYEAISDQLRFAVLGQTSVTVTGFSSSAIHVVGLGDSIQKIAANVTQAADGTYSVSFTNTTNVPEVFYTYTDATIAQPLSIAYHNAPSLSASSNSADLLIVSYKDFIPALAPLVAKRQQQGLNVKVVDVDDVYSEFNYGEHSPYALQEFLQTASTVWAAAPKWLLLVGGASVDPRNYLGFGSFDFVPTKIVPTEELKTASDGWLSDFSGTGFEQIATGRLPVQSAAETTTVVNRILAYESLAAGTWSQSAYVVADQNIGADFQSEAATIATQLSAGLTVTTLNVSDPSTDHTTVIDQLNAGNLIVNYIGHGSEDDWATPSFFNGSDAAALTNGAMAPFVVSMDCLNGLFHDVYETSLAQSLMLAPSGGAVAVWASSGLTDSAPQFGMDEALMQYLFANPAQTIGEATKNAKQGVTEPDVRRTWILFGDPSMKLKSAAGN